MDWKQIQRIKWDHANFVMFLEDDDVAFEAKRDSKIGKFESQKKKIERNFWHRDADSAWVRGSVDDALP